MWQHYEIHANKNTKQLSRQFHVAQFVIFTVIAQIIMSIDNYIIFLFRRCFSDCSSNQTDWLDKHSFHINKFSFDGWWNEDVLCGIKRVAYAFWFLYIFVWITTCSYIMVLSVGDYYIQCTLKCSTNEIISLSNSI